jgi:hypothetical protein
MSNLRKIVEKTDVKLAAAALTPCSITIPGDSKTPVKLLAIELKLSGAATTTTDALTVTLDNAAGAAYDTVIYSVTRATTGAVTSVAQAWDAGYPCAGGSSIVVTWTHTDANDAYLTVRYEVM